MDLGHDIALLKIDPPTAGCPIVQLADHSPRPGAEVYCVGAPLFRHRVLLSGKVAATGTTFEYYAERYVEVIDLAATIAMGMSGGPWLDDAGHLVGVQSGVLTQNSVSVGLAFCVRCRP